MADHQLGVIPPGSSLVVSLALALGHRRNMACNSPSIWIT
jgi:hypothetical protein